MVGGDDAAPVLLDYLEVIGGNGATGGAVEILEAALGWEHRTVAGNLADLDGEGV